MVNKLALGTVQFGLDYGVSNSRGRVPAAEVGQILAACAAAGVDTVDTAIAYGDSELVLGQQGVSAFRVVTKLPSIPAEVTDVQQWVEIQVTQALRRMRLDQLEGLLLHAPAQLLGAQGQQLLRALKGVQAAGLVRQLGVSIYTPDELAPLLEVLPVGIVQAPVSVLDQRLITSGWLTHLHSRGIEVHARSIFLQGLLLMEPTARPDRFRRWDPVWRQWHEWLKSQGVSALEACLRFALSQPELARVVVGVDGLAHFQQLEAVRPLPLPAVPDFSDFLDETILTPSRWPEE